MLSRILYAQRILEKYILLQSVKKTLLTMQTSIYMQSDKMCISQMIRVISSMLNYIQLNGNIWKSTIFLRV